MVRPQPAAASNAMRNPKQSTRVLFQRCETSSALQAQIALGQAILCSAKPLKRISRHGWNEGWKPSHNITEGIES